VDIKGEERKMAEQRVSDYKDLAFPKGFLWGAATSAYQVEGNCQNCDWWHWEYDHPGFIIDGTKSGLAADHYNRFEEDFALASRLGHNAYRFSIEWSRIEPEEGVWDYAEVDHYRRVLESLHKYGMTPLVTLFHWTNPWWIAKKGGWLNPEIVDYVTRYAAFVAGELGDLVPVWFTLNEPMVLSILMYGLGTIPPFKSGAETARPVALHELEAHTRMYQAVHEATKNNSIVGIVQNLECIEPANEQSADDRELARQLDLSSNEFVLAAVDTGVMGPPWGDGEEVPGLKGSWDAIGINYYSRSLVDAERKLRPQEDQVASSEGDLLTASEELMRRRRDIAKTAAEINSPYFSPWSDTGYHPEGLYKEVMRVSKYGRPIYITENGIHTLDDKERNRHLVQHLRQAHRAIQDGADLRGYCYWSLLETWEWSLGHLGHMGMWALEPETLNRLPRPVAYLFRDIAKRNTISAEQLKEYASDQREIRSESWT
jgi:beta-glucosidase